MSNVSDTQIRDKILTYLKRQGEATTRHVFYALSTLANETKVRDVLNGLLEEEEVFMRKVQRGKVFTYYWSIDGSGFPEEKPPMTISEMNQILNSNTTEPKMNVENSELEKLLKHEYEIILRKQHRRRALAEKILQSADAAIKHIEGLIK